MWHKIFRRLAVETYYIGKTLTLFSIDHVRLSKQLFGLCKGLVTRIILKIYRIIQYSKKNLSITW